MRSHVACTGHGTCSPFATFGHTPAPYAYRGLSTSGFALPWRTAKDGSRRIISGNDTAVALVPCLGRYAYEVYVSPKRTHASLAELFIEALQDFADDLGKVLNNYDNLWQLPFPYDMP